jgi:hypothetical protein
METIKGHETDRLKPLTQYKFKRLAIHSGAIRETPSEFVNHIKSEAFQGQMWKGRYRVYSHINVEIIYRKYELQKRKLKGS